jgi:hypothetical protein
MSPHSRVRVLAKEFCPHHLVMLPVKKLGDPTVKYQIPSLTCSAVIDGPPPHLFGAYRSCGSSHRLHMPPGPIESHHR